jgi:hypothetical protein
MAEKAKKAKKAKMVRQLHNSQALRNPTIYYVNGCKTGPTALV